jgi:ribosomal protein S12 methylthiotransferase
MEAEMAVKVGMVNLGCAKNQVDGEIMMSSIKKAGFTVVTDPGRADIAIVNTCGFIESAKQESINEIMELVQLKKEGRIKKIVVTGCLAERYRKEIMKEIPEADAVIGIGDDGNISERLKEIYSGKTIENFPDKYGLPLCGDRILTTPSYFAYLKIAEGCSNWCSYCAIPMIRGKYRSRTLENVQEEAEKLVKEGAKEIILIAQDTTKYGIDLYGKVQLPELLRRLCRIEGLRWIRVLYSYPEGIDDELIRTFSEENKIVKYFDIPIQHISDRILKDMNRQTDSKKIKELLQKIRREIPEAIIRTTLIAGFPGETDEDFEELAKFVKEQKFDRMGCFPYSREEGTKAAAMENQIDEDTIQHRAELLNESQSRIMEENNQKYIGKTITVMTEGFDRFAECYFGRSYMDAPDTDGKIFFSPAARKPKYGEFVQVAVEDAVDCDLMGTMIE